MLIVRSLSTPRQVLHGCRQLVSCRRLVNSLNERQPLGPDLYTLRTSRLVRKTSNRCHWAVVTGYQQWVVRNANLRNTAI